MKQKRIAPAEIPLLSAQPKKSLMLKFAQIATHFTQARKKS